MVDRRQFLRATLPVLPVLAGVPSRAADPAGRWPAAIIGHTGRGDYGHGLDTAMLNRGDIQVVAVADADPAGLAKAVDRLGKVEGFADYREMLAKVRPKLVVVAPRHSDQHHSMILAALRSGAHVFTEKPFTTTPAEADALLAEATTRALAIAVAHQMRLAPTVTELKRRWEAGEFGELISINAWGKQDARAGGEDMVVLGTHLFDLMRLFAGEAEWATARVRRQGRPITRAEARIPSDNVGLVAGDEVFAQFSFSGGALGTFTSRGDLRESTGRWGLELRGSKGAARLCADISPEVFVAQSTGWTADGRTDEWKRPAWAPAKPPPDAGGANRRVVDDWLAAIAAKRDPACSGTNAAKAVEMVMAVYQAALTGRRVALPLTERGHPLAPPTS